MRQIPHYLVASLTLLFALSGCKEYDATLLTGELQAPILKYIQMPSVDDVIPGTVIKIRGTGFSEGDVISCKSLEGEADFTPTVVSADNFGISIQIPANAGGEYQVAVARAGLTTVLNEHLNVAFVFIIDNLYAPASAAPGETITIQGEGFENGDKLKFVSEAYPTGSFFIVNTTTTTDGISVTVPENSYGLNNLIVIRGKKTCSIGSLKVPVNIGDHIGGGVVFYTSDNGLHGLIAAPANTGVPQTFAPSIQVEPYASGTQESIYTGKGNTSILVKGIASWRSAGNSCPATPAELCDQYSVIENGVVYDDWFLGSLKEMEKLFLYRSTLSAPYGLIPAENYWTSSVFPGSSWAWAYYYVNFWESVNLVTGAAPCDVWVIATRPIRQF